MRIYLTKTFDVNGGFIPGEMISAYVAQKVENGYIVNIGGTEIFAQCSLNLNTGDFLKMKVTESSESRIVFKVVQYETKESKSESRLPMPIDIPDTPEARTAFNLLLKLNLPIKKEYLAFIIDLFDELTDDEKPEPLLSPTKEPPSQSEKLSFHKTLAKFINSGFTAFEDRLLESLQDPTALEDEAFYLNETLMHHKTRTVATKEYLALKALNLLHKKGSGNETVFFGLPIPFYHNIFLKISKESSVHKTQPMMNLSFVINTKNLGAILVDLTYINGEVSASSTFENEKAMNIVKKAMAMNKNGHSLVNTMRLKVGKVSLKDFLFSEITEPQITTGINLKI